MAKAEEIYGPSIVDTLGNALYLLEYSGHQDAKDRIKNRVRAVERYIESAEEGTPERLYRERLYLIAQEYAGGKMKRRIELEDKKGAVREEFEVKMKHLDEGSKIGSKISEWGERLLAGGVGTGIGYLAFTALEKSGLVDPAAAQQFEHIGSFTLGGTLAYLAKGIRHNRYTHAANSIREVYQKKVDEAEAEFDKGMQKEHERAWKMAKVAWEASFQTAVPERDLVKEELIGDVEGFDD